MKNKLFIILPVLCLFLSSCFDIEETYNLNSDGSYALTYKVDMGALLGIANTMMPDSVKQSSNYNVEKDSTINLSSIPDSLKYKFSEKELGILDQTKMRTQMNMNKGIFKITLDTKGKSIEDLKYFLSNFGNIFQKSKVNNMLMNPPSGAEMGEKSGSPTDALGGDDAGMPFENKEYDYVVTASSFERKIRPEILLASKEKNKAVYEMMQGMNMKITSTIIINLPRPAANIENPKAILSADRKQFKLVLDMMEATAHPEILNFKVNY